MRAICLAHFIVLELIILIILGEEYKLCNFLQPTLLHLSSVKIFSSALCSQKPWIRVRNALFEIRTGYLLYINEKGYDSAEVLDDSDVTLRDNWMLCLMQRLTNTDRYYRSTDVRIYIAWRKYCCNLKSIHAWGYFEQGKRSIYLGMISIFRYIENDFADHSGMSHLRPLEHWGLGFESHSRHGYLCAFILFVLCYA
jgi:hypothetical protein